MEILFLNCLQHMADIPIVYVMSGVVISKTLPEVKAVTEN
jgi:hypothetical protein